MLIVPFLNIPQDKPGIATRALIELCEQLSTHSKVVSESSVGPPGDRTVRFTHALSGAMLTTVFDDKHPYSLARADHHRRIWLGMQECPHGCIMPESCNHADDNKAIMAEVVEAFEARLRAHV